MKRRMGLLDTDPVYAGKLARRLCELDDFPYWVFVFQSKEELISYLEGHHLHLLLVSSSLADDAVLSLPADLILILSEEEDFRLDSKPESNQGISVSGTPLSESFIKRYQSVPDLIREVKEKLEEEKGDIVKKEGVRIFGIFSPTPLPERDRVIREIMSSEKENTGYNGQRSFLITLASFSDLAPKEEENRYDISDAYYFWKQNKLKEHLSELVCSGEEFDYIPGVYFPEDLLVISRDRIRVFLKDLADYSGCSEVFIDFASLGSDVSLIRSLCDEQIMPFYDRTESRGRISSYEEYVSRSGHGDWLDRIIPYHLQDC